MSAEFSEELDPGVTLQPRRSWIFRLVATIAGLAIFAGAVAEDIDALTDAMHVVAREARTIEGRLSKEQWIVGANYSATDMVIFPWIQVLRRALDRSAAAELGARFLPMERNYPALARWIHRIEALPGYERTYPPHWREG